MNYQNIPIVAECCEHSENIKDYFLEEKYLGEVDQVEALSPEILSVMAVNLLLDELSDIGIETNQTAEELLQSTLDRKVMFYLREKFDKDKFYRFMKSLTEQQYSDLCGVIENCETYQDLLIELTDFSCELYPQDIAWEAISSALDYWYSTREFSRHISALQNKFDLHTDPNKTNITDNNIQEVCRFLQKMKERDSQLALLIKYVLFRYLQETDLTAVDIEEIYRQQKFYDRDKLHPDLLPYFAHYEATKSIDPNMKEPKFVLVHHRQTPHHIEHWEDIKERTKLNALGEYLGPSKSDAIMIVLSLVLDGYRKDKLEQELDQYKTYASTEILDFMKNLGVLVDWDAVLRGDVK